MGDMLQKRGMWAYILIWPSQFPFINIYERKYTVYTVSVRVHNNNMQAVISQPTREWVYLAKKMTEHAKKREKFKQKAKSRECLTVNYEGPHTEKSRKKEEPTFLELRASSWNENARAKVGHWSQTLDPLFHVPSR